MTCGGYCAYSMPRRTTRFSQPRQTKARGANLSAILGLLYKRKLLLDNKAYEASLEVGTTIATYARRSQGLKQMHQIAQ